MFNPRTFKSERLDAAGNVFFARQLEFVQNKIYEFQYPELRAFRFIPIDFSAPAGAEFVTATQYKSTGRARIINSYADDLPQAAILGMQLTTPVRSIGTSYRYSHQEIRNAQMAGLPLSIQLASAARLANDQLINDLAISGDAETGLTGIVNNPNVPVITVPANGVGNTTQWVNKSAEQILSDMNLAINSVVANTNGVELPDTLLLPLAQYTYIASTPRSPNSDTTILDYFKLNNEFVRDVSWIQQLAGAGEAGSDVMIAYRQDPNKLAMQIPMAFTQYAPQERNLEFVINCESRFGGVSIYYPMSMLIAEGI